MGVYWCTGLHFHIGGGDSLYIYTEDGCGAHTPVRRAFRFAIVDDRRLVDLFLFVNG